MARDYELDEPLSALALFDAAQQRAQQKTAPAPLYRPRVGDWRSRLARWVLAAVTLVTLGWLAWWAAIAPA
jgi:hypothetical protein